MTELLDMEQLRSRLGREIDQGVDCKGRFGVYLFRKHPSSNGHHLPDQS